MKYVIVIVLLFVCCLGVWWLSFEERGEISGVVAKYEYTYNGTATMVYLSDVGYDQLRPYEFQTRITGLQIGTHYVFTYRVNRMYSRLINGRWYYADGWVTYSEYLKRLGKEPTLAQQR